MPWRSTLKVPFSPEAPLSGIGDTGLFRACWYRRRVDVPAPADGRRLLIHFGAVDYSAQVWVNGHLAGQHEGGYTPFAVDVTHLLAGDGRQEIVVRAEDDPADLEKPRGKQDWLPEPHAIWYPRTTGIWQTVWLEEVPDVYIERLRWTLAPERWEVLLEARLKGGVRRGMRLRVRLAVGRRLLTDDAYSVEGDTVRRRIAVPSPPADGRAGDLVWSPARPTLIDARLELLDARGRLVDAVESYTALRSAAVDGGRFLLNGKPHNLRMVLDQGYWPDGGYTAPSAAALRRDVELAKAMGFDGVRKHQKIEDPRYLYWADRLGLLVWEEMPAAYRFSPRAAARLLREWTAVIERDASHPCIVAWVPFNESWGVPEMAASRQQQDYVRAGYYLTKALDQSRPVVGNDGWESVATDILGVHDYEQDAERLAARYRSEESFSELLGGPGPERRKLVLGERPGALVMLTEFGGISHSPHPERTWGYSIARSPEELADRYARLAEATRASRVLSGSCYTQFADTYQETNGLLYADRRPKFPLEEIARDTRGRQP